MRQLALTETHCTKYRTMKTDLNNLWAFIAVANAKGYREASRKNGVSASRLSDAIKKLESDLGVQLLHRTTRTVVPTNVGYALLNQLSPAMTEIELSIDKLNVFRDRPAGKLRLNVPMSAAKLILADIIPEFMQKYPEIELEVTADSDVQNIFEAGFDAGIRYAETLEKDMIAIPIGPRVQRYATVAAPSLLSRLGEPETPDALINYPCILGRFKSGVVNTWEFERNGEQKLVRVTGPLIVSLGGGVDVAISSAIKGSGVITLFEEWLAPYINSGQLVPILEPWWVSFNGPYLYYSGRNYTPSALRAFIDFIKERSW